MKPPYSLKAGAVYRYYQYYYSDKTKEYADLLCINKQVLKIVSLNGTTFRSKVGDLVTGELENLTLLTNSIEEYDIITEGSITVVHTQRVLYYNDTIIDKLYNWYCKLLKREKSEFV